MTAASVGQWVVKNPGWRLLSILLAVFIWMNVATEPEMSAFVNAPVQFKDPPAGLDVLTLGETVQLEARGSSGELRDLANTRPVVTLDFSDIRQPGDRTFTITRNEVKLPRGIELIRAIPPQIHFRFVKRSASR